MIRTVGPHYLHQTSIYCYACPLYTTLFALLKTSLNDVMVATTEVAWSPEAEKSFVFSAPGDQATAEGDE